MCHHHRQSLLYLIALVGLQTVRILYNVIIMYFVILLLYDTTTAFKTLARAGEKFSFTFQ
jgi:hypothetical protein